MGGLESDAQQNQTCLSLPRAPFAVAARIENQAWHLKNRGAQSRELSTIDRPAYSVPLHIDESGERLRCQLVRITPPDSGRRAPRTGRARLLVG
jgi:hypothetical protein